MQVLILSANIGGGHNAAGRALAHALVRRGAEAQVVDGIGLESPFWSHHVEQLYYKAVRWNPKLFGASFKTVAWFSSPNVRSLPYILSNINLPRVTHFIRDCKPDAILATHVFCGQMLTHLIKHGRISQYTAGIVTDYGYTPYWNETMLNDYFLPHGEQVEMYTAHGIDKAKLHPMGIPILQVAAHNTAAAKRKMGIDPGRKHVVIVGGAIGMGKLQEIIRMLNERLPEDVLISIVCASNETARQVIAERFGNTARIRVLGFVRPLSDLMAAADLFVSKAGGLTSTEIFSQRIPYITLYSVPPIETDNEQIFMQHGVAYPARSAHDAAEAALRLLYNAQTAEAMIKAQAVYIPENAADTIADHVVRATASLNRKQLSSPCTSPIPSLQDESQRFYQSMLHLKQ